MGRRTATKTTPATTTPATPPGPAAVPGRATRSRHQIDDRVVYARQFPVHVGVDTGKSFHQLVAAGPDGRRLDPRRVDTSRESFEAADAYLRATFPDVPRERMLVGVELAGHHGVTFAEFLADRGYALVTVLPSVTKKLKEVEDNSPGKHDVKDAGQVCGLLKMGFFVHWPRLSETVAQMRVLTTERLRLTREETGLKNRLQAVLDVAWPEFLTVVPPLSKHTPRVLLTRWPLPADLLAARASTVTEAARVASRGQFKAADVETLRRLTKTTIGLRTAQEARRAEIARLVARWTLLKAQMAELDARLVELVEQHPGAKALLTVPEVSHLCAATLVAELGTPESYVSPRQVLKMAGMNLAGRESGTSVRGRIKQTKRGRPGLRRQLFLLAGRWCSKRGAYRAYYEAMTARNGGAKIKAMCAVARKLVPMLLHVMQTGEAFDLARWQGRRHLRLALSAPPVPATVKGGKSSNGSKRAGRGGARSAVSVQAPTATSAPVPMDQDGDEDTPYREDAMTA